MNEILPEKRIPIEWPNRLFF